ncbi:MAG: hypothetical protein IH830_12355, partial [Planctomycetes bacterium]|nr:hypothetical protein [Planctomycetota bacterium]
MKRNVTRIRDLLTLGLFILGPCLFNSPAQGDFLRVDGTNGTCAGNGSGWGAAAFKYLQDALAEADPVDQIWVAQGIYFVDQDCLNPDGTGDRESTFQLKPLVLLLGGFVGNEDAAEQRDPLTHITILSGAVAQGPNPGVCPDTEGCNASDCPFTPPQDVLDGCCCCRVCDVNPACCTVGWDELCVELATKVCGGAYHVVTAGAEITDSFTTIIDGFTIQDGTASGGGTNQDRGGGMLITGQPSVIRCIFTNNLAGDEGGGVSIVGVGIEPQLINCEFRDNPGSQAGLVIYMTTNGGGLANNNATPTLTNCLFANNEVDRFGGAIYNTFGPACDFDEDCGPLTLINSTLAENVANLNGFGNGGGIVNTTPHGVVVVNSILWDN